MGPLPSRCLLLSQGALPRCPLQMDLDAAATAQLLEWLLQRAAPVERADLLSRLGRRPPGTLGAVLFSALREAGGSCCAHARDRPVREPLQSRPAALN